MTSGWTGHLLDAARHVAMAGVVITLAAGCQNKISGRDIVLVDSNAGMKLVQGKSSLLGIGPKAGTWVDPRPASEFAQGHIPGAVNIPFVEFEELYQQKLEGFRALVVYGNDYNDWRAEGMAKRLMALDYGDVHVLQGGLRAWTAAGNTVETGG